MVLYNPFSAAAELFHFQIKALSSLARLRLLNVLSVRLRRLNPLRLDFIFELKLVLLELQLVEEIGSALAAGLGFDLPLSENIIP